MRWDRPYLSILSQNAQKVNILGEFWRDFAKIGEICVIIMVLVSSSSGPGRLVLIQEIAGSTPAGTTNISLEGYFLLLCAQRIY